jgi:hypothetical protein
MLTKGITMLRRKQIVIGAAGALLSACNPPAPVSGPPATFSRQDSVGVAWRLVYAYVRAVDQYARPIGELPASLEPVVRAGEAGPDIDLWGRAIRYRPAGFRFEVRSSGSDGIFETEDDITALGQLGRNQPCSVRDEFRLWTGIGFEPPCEPDATIVVLPRCPELREGSNRIDATPRDRQDSVRVMGLRLVRIARAVDGIGRDLGGLPLSLRPVPRPPSRHTDADRLSMDEHADLWGRALRYVRNGQDYEIRSAGSDGRFGTGDDIWIQGRLARTVPCAFRVGVEVLHCGESPPECAEPPGDGPAAGPAAG